MTSCHIGTCALGASVFAWLANWSAALQAIAAIFAIAAYLIALYKSLKKK